MGSETIIGVVAGAGPFAGLDLLGKILDQTEAKKDQEHLTVASLSRPNQIPDRTAFLLGQSDINPAFAIIQQLEQLQMMGVSVAGIPCNTAHAPAIFDVILKELHRIRSQVRFLHMIKEVARFLSDHYSEIRRVGVLATTGTYRTQIYPKLLEPAGFEILVPSIDVQEQTVHQAIYHPEYGIKACGVATQQSRKNLWTAGRELYESGAEAVILGCTEIPLVITERRMEEMIVVDPTLILARALIREANATRLKPVDK